MDLSNKLIIKARLDNDVRKIAPYSEDMTLDDLVLMMQRVFKNKLRSTQDITLKYLDEDGDLITISDQSDLSLAIDACRILKLTIFVNNEDGVNEGGLGAQVRQELTELRDRADSIIRRLDNACLTSACGGGGGQAPLLNGLPSAIDDKTAATACKTRSVGLAHHHGPGGEEAPIRPPPDVVGQSREFDPLGSSGGPKQASLPKQTAATTTQGGATLSRSESPASSVSVGGGGAKQQQQQQQQGQHQSQGDEPPPPTIQPTTYHHQQHTGSVPSLGDHFGPSSQGGHGGQPPSALGAAAQYFPQQAQTGHPPPPAAHDAYGSGQNGPGSDPGMYPPASLMNNSVPPPPTGLAQGKPTKPAEQAPPPPGPGPNMPPLPGPPSSYGPQPTSQAQAPIMAHPQHQAMGVSQGPQYPFAPQMPQPNYSSSSGSPMPPAVSSMGSVQQHQQQQYASPGSGPLAGMGYAPQQQAGVGGGPPTSAGYQGGDYGGNYPPKTPPPGPPGGAGMAGGAPPPMAPPPVFSSAAAGGNPFARAGSGPPGSHYIRPHFQ